jgi:hypothetical protein
MELRSYKPSGEREYVYLIRESKEKLLVLALGEIAAQLAELNKNSTKTRTVVNIPADPFPY